MAQTRGLQVREPDFDLSGQSTDPRGQRFDLKGQKFEFKGQNYYLRGQNRGHKGFITASQLPELLKTIPLLSSKY